MSDEMESFRVSVYYQTEEERASAQAILESVSPQHTYVYNGVIDGWLTQDKLDELKAAGLTVIRTGKSAKKQFPPELQEQIKRLEQLATSSPSGKDFYEVRLKEPLRDEWRRELESLGELDSFKLPNIVRLSLAEENLGKVDDLPYVAAVARFGIAETVTPDLLRALMEAETAREASRPELAADFGETSTEKQVLDILLYRPEDREKVLRAIEERRDAKLVGASTNALRVECELDPAFIARLADLSEVKSLSIYNPPSLLCDHARRLVGIESINNGGLDEWNGEGEVVGIFDSGIDATHRDLEDRIIVKDAVIGASAADKIGHGTHVAGIIAGIGVASGSQVRGVAPGAKLIVYGITDDSGALQIAPFVDLGDLLRLATAQGAKIINLSWGTPIGGSYDHGSLSVDRFVYNHPEVLVVVAAGNNGQVDRVSGGLIFNTIGTPASAKNVLTVGASATDRNEAQFRKTWAEFRPESYSRPKPILSLVAGDPDLHAANSSRGPTDFDSVKPDLLAPGTFILSTRAADIPDRRFWMNCEQFNGEYAYLGGTSMAAPIVAGLAAVLRQYLTKKVGVVNPSAALMKSILIASARRLSPMPSIVAAENIGYPDFDHGFGRIDLSNVLPHSGASQKRKLLLADIPNNSPDALVSRAPIGAPHKAVQTYRVGVAANPTEPLRIVLVWTDAPGNHIQNNLQLEVRAPERNYVGNQEHTFRKYPQFDDKNSDNIPFDKQNNVEQVCIGKVKPGDYLIRVIAQNTPFPPQGYALCVCGEINSDILEDA
jgi:serine protease AprX